MKTTKLIIAFCLFGITVYSMPNLGNDETSIKFEVSIDEAK